MTIKWPFDDIVADDIVAASEVHPRLQLLLFGKALTII